VSEEWQQNMDKRKELAEVKVCQVEDAEISIEGLENQQGLDMVKVAAVVEERIDDERRYFIVS